MAKIKPIEHFSLSWPKNNVPNRIITMAVGTGHKPNDPAYQEWGEATRLAHPEALIAVVASGERCDRVVRGFNGQTETHEGYIWFREPPANSPDPVAEHGRVVLGQAARLNQFHSRLLVAANLKRREAGMGPLNSGSIHSLGFSGGGTIAQVAAVTRPYPIAGYVNHSGLLVNFFEPEHIKSNPPGLFTYGTHDEIYAMKSPPVSSDRATTLAAVAITRLLRSGDAPLDQTGTMVVMRRAIREYKGFTAAVADLPDKGRLLTSVATFVGGQLRQQGPSIPGLKEVRHRLKVAHLIAEGEGIGPFSPRPPASVQKTLESSLTAMQKHGFDVQIVIRPGMDHGVDNVCERAAHAFLAGHLRLDQNVGTVHVSQLQPYDLDRDQLAPAYALTQQQITRTRRSMTASTMAEAAQDFSSLSRRQIAGAVVGLAQAKISSGYRVFMRQALPTLYEIANGPTRGFRRLAASMAFGVLGSIAPAQAHQEVLVRSGRAVAPTATQNNSSPSA